MQCAATGDAFGGRLRGLSWFQGEAESGCEDLEAEKRRRSCLEDILVALRELAVLVCGRLWG